MQALIDSYSDPASSSSTSRIMFDNFDTVLDGFWFTFKLSIIAGVLSLLWGLVLAVLRQTPGRSARSSACRRSPTSTSSAGFRRCS